MRIFLSAVSGQFEDARQALASDLRAVGAEVVVQEDFQQHGRTLLEKLEEYIATCDRVIALVGDAYGWESDVADGGGSRRSYSQWEYFFAQGERLNHEGQQPIDTYVYFASPEFLATHAIAQEADATTRQHAFVTRLRDSGKDWNEFSSTNELRALVLRDGFRLPTANREPFIAQIGTVFNIQPASAKNPRLTPILIKRLRPLLDRHVLFGGRAAELGRLDSHLRNRASGYMFVTGRSGFGKTALLANWVRKLTQDKIALCYHFISRIDETAGEEFALRSLCQQLASHHGLTGELPADKDRLRALYSDLLSLPPQVQQLVIVLDGLDEAVGWTPAADMFPAPLPPGVFVVFSAREIAGRDWLDELGLTAASVERLNLSNLSAAEIVHLLRDQEPSAARWAGDVGFVDVIWRRSGGDPFYVNLLVRDIEKGLIQSQEDLERQPSGLKDYLNKWWQEVSQATGDKPVRDLLGYLLVAKGRLTRDDLTNISDEDSLDDWVFDRTIKLLERYIVGGATEGYSLAHPRFQEYITGEKIKASAQRPYRAKLLAYCRRWQEHKSPYSLAYFTTHLAEDGQWVELHELLTIGDKLTEWADARLESEGSYGGYLRDLQLGRTASAERAAEGGPLQVRYTLIESTIQTLSGNIPADLLSALVPHVWTQAHALAHTRSVPADRDRTDALRALTPGLDERHRLEAWGIAREIADPARRIAAVSALCAFLPLEQQRQVLQEVASREDENELGRTVAALTRHLSIELRPEALELVSGLKEDHARVHGMLDMAPCLSTDNQEFILITVKELKNERVRAAALGRLAATLPPPLNAVAMQFIDEIQVDVLRAKAVFSWVRHFPDDVQLELLGSRLGGEPSEFAVIDVLLPELEEDVKQGFNKSRRALVSGLGSYAWDAPDERAAASLRYIQSVRGVLDSFFAALSEESRDALIRLVTRVAATRRLIAYASSGVLDSLDSSLHAAAIEAARSIRDPEPRVRACVRLARYLDEAQSATLLREALAWTAELRDEDRQANTLYGFYDCLPERFRSGPWTETEPPDGDDRTAFVRWALANAWLDHRYLWTAKDAPGPLGSSNLLRQIAEHVPEPLKQHLTAAAEGTDQNRPAGEAFAGIANELPHAWLQTMRDGLSALSELSELSISDNWIEVLAAEHPDTATSLRVVQQTLDSSALSLGGRPERKVLRKLVHALPEEVRTQVTRATLAATQTIGGSAGNAQFCVRLVRFVSTHLTPLAVREALGRLDAIKDRKSLSAYEKQLLELIYQVPVSLLSEVLARVQAEPDSWMRARILLESSGPMLAPVQEQALAILCGIEENSLEVGLRLVAALDDDLQPRALARVRQVADVQARARMLADLTEGLSSPLREEVTREMLEIPRQVEEPDRERILSDLATRLPLEARINLLPAAREIDDPSLKASALMRIAPNLADPLCTNVALEALHLLPEIPETWRRISLLEGALELPAPVQAEAVAAARAVIERARQPAILGKLAAGMAPPRQRDVQDEALAIARQIEDTRTRVLVLAELCEYLPPDERAAIAGEGWESFTGLSAEEKTPSAEETTWRMQALAALMPHLPIHLAGRAAADATEVMEKLSAGDRQRWASVMKHALELREKPTDRSPARLTSNAGEPVTIVQRDLRAIRLLTLLSRDKKNATIEDVRKAVAAIKSSSLRGGILRQLIRSVPDELRDAASSEVLGAVQALGSKRLYAADTEPLYMELADQLTGPAKATALAKALTADHHRAGRKESLEMATAWEANHFDADVGRRLFSALLAETAKRNRHEAMANLAAMIPLMAELYNRPAVDATFEAFRDVTTWWP